MHHTFDQTSIPQTSLLLPPEPVLHLSVESKSSRSKDTGHLQTGWSKCSFARRLGEPGSGGLHKPAHLHCSRQFPIENNRFARILQRTVDPLTAPSIQSCLLWYSNTYFGFKHDPPNTRFLLGLSGSQSPQARTLLLSPSRWQGILNHVAERSLNTTWSSPFSPKSSKRHERVWEGSEQRCSQKCSLVHLNVFGKP